MLFDLCRVLFCLIAGFVFGVLLYLDWLLDMTLVNISWVIGCLIVLGCIVLVIVVCVCLLYLFERCGEFGYYVIWLGVAYGVCLFDLLLVICFAS